MNKNRLLLLGVLQILFCAYKIPAASPYKDSHLPVDKRAADLLSRMTLEEKIRLGIPVLFIDMDHKPSDTYLWLTGEAARMLKGEKPLRFTMPESR